MCCCPAQEDVANQLRACCAIYNLLHEYDGFQAHQRWGKELAAAKTFAQPQEAALVPRSYEDGSYLVDYDDQVLSKKDLEILHKQFKRKSAAHKARMKVAQQALSEGFDASYVGTNPLTDLGDDVTEIEEDWASLRNKLVGHYVVACALKYVRWIF